MMSNFLYFVFMIAIFYFILFGLLLQPYSNTGIHFCFLNHLENILQSLLRHLMLIAKQEFILCYSNSFNLLFPFFNITHIWHITKHCLNVDIIDYTKHIVIASIFIARNIEKDQYWWYIDFIFQLFFMFEVILLYIVHCNTIQLFLKHNCLMYWTLKLITSIFRWMNLS